VKVLADTHTWLWMLTDPDRLPPGARAVLADLRTDVLVSAASAWEIGIKHALGKLPLPEPPASFVTSRIGASGCELVDITAEQALGAAALPSHHRDPFDRLLIAQSQLLRVPLCSGDRAFDPYEVDLLWS
jgi:PIN domain nuclease of toxin-antitoxin system